MGASNSRQTPTNDVFERELRGINDIVNMILNEDNTFKNEEYNFLSQEVCNNYQVILESELSKHLKIHLAELKSNIYVVPKEDRDNLSKIRMKKNEICELISSHYIKILYILSVVKYIYNLENNGDRSFGGIIFRNMKITDNWLEIQFCNREQIDINNVKQKQKVSLDNLDGFRFFLKYFLSRNETKCFLKLLRAILAKNGKAGVRSAVCECIKAKAITKEEIDVLGILYRRNYGEPLTCTKTPLPDVHDSTDVREVDTSVFINKGNPVFLGRYCTFIDNRVINIDTREGKEAKKIYDEMVANYKKNMLQVASILKELVIKTSTGYVLMNIDSVRLNNIIEKTKSVIRQFFFQSILDYHHLLDVVKNIPNVKLSINPDGFA